MLDDKLHSIGYAPPPQEDHLRTGSEDADHACQQASDMEKRHRGEGD